MKFNYLVTTDINRIPDRKVIMLDGTVPNWKPKSGDWHFDHHRTGGSKIQMQEIPGDFCNNLTGNEWFVTTQVDADACAAAAWCQVGGQLSWENTRKLEAIAYDCDYLCVPPQYQDLGDFASQAVAAMKSNSNKLLAELHLPSNRKTWNQEQKETFASAAFKLGTESLVNACLGNCKFPGELGEAEDYWETVKQHIQIIQKQGLISLCKECLIFDARAFDGIYVDPRCWLKASAQIVSKPITLTMRKMLVDKAFQGYSYTLGTVPLHPDTDQTDYTINAWRRLTLAEARGQVPYVDYLDLAEIINNNWGDSKLSEMIGFDPWGGRATVGGSGWRTASKLLPEQIINIVLKAI